MDAPLVSIIIDNYNYGRFLPDAIESALNQTYPLVEVIVVDDGSTDNSRDIIASSGNRIIPVLKENGGMASTYNAGFAVSRGQIIIFLDADDVLLPSAAEMIVEHFDSKMAKLHWPLLETDACLVPSGGRVPPGPLASGDLRPLLMSEGPDAYRSPPTSGNAFARWFLERVLPMPESEFRQHADAYLVTLAAVHGSTGALAQPQGLYRVHGRNDYAVKHLDEKVRRNLALYELRCHYLSRALSQQGVDTSLSEWMGDDKPYRWLSRLHGVIETIRSTVPVGNSYLLLDGGELSDTSGVGQVVSGRRDIPFTERDGVYWGPPTGDTAAIAELERQRHVGSSHLVVGWPAFWWLDYYADFHQYLRDRYRCLFESEDVIVFALDEG